ncbi:MAG: hypothetical protein SFV23_07775 [Planctomycetaceae bacterium]|nr:hypothetical protein [Planctomycetaceae bacterium]
MSETASERIDRVMREGTELLNAMRVSVREATKRYIVAGELMSTWKDGRVVWVDPVTLMEVSQDQPVTVV